MNYCVVIEGLTDDAYDEVIDEVGRRVTYFSERTGYKYRVTLVSEKAFKISNAGKFTKIRIKDSDGSYNEVILDSREFTSITIM